MASTKSGEMDTLSPSPHIQNQVTLLDEQCEGKHRNIWRNGFEEGRKENYFILLSKERDMADTVK